MAGQGERVREAVSGEGVREGVAGGAGSGERTGGSDLIHLPP